MSASLEQLERRVVALEKAQVENTATLKWVSGTLGQIQAVQEQHTQELREMKADLTEMKAGIKRLDRAIDETVGALDRKIDAVDRKVESMASSLARIVGDAVREAIKPR